MQFKIGKPVVIKNPKSVYVLEFEVMHGDADGYSTEVWEYSESRKNDFIETLKVFKEIEKVKNGYEEEHYPEIEGYNEYVSENWPSDHTCSDYPAALQEYKIYYYDENGVKHHVELVE